MVIRTRTTDPALAAFAPHPKPEPPRDGKARLGDRGQPRPQPAPPPAAAPMQARPINPAFPQGPAHGVPATHLQPPPLILPLKKHIGLRLDEDVIAAFRATGKGWQTRINLALRAAAAQL